MEYCLKTISGSKPREIKNTPEWLGKIPRDDNAVGKFLYEIGEDIRGLRNTHMDDAFRSDWWPPRATGRTDQERSLPCRDRKDHL